MKKEYKCPQCSSIKLLAECSWNEAIRLKRLCKSCAMKKWQTEKYGEKQTREFISTCPKCKKEKLHKWKNISETRIQTLIGVMSTKMCKSCSNSVYYVLSKTKKNTKPEREFKKIARQLKIKYRQGWKYKGYNFDFYLPELKILVEIDGNYWHGKGLKLKELNPTQTNSRKNDEKKNKICLENSQPLIRLWEDEVTEQVIKNKLII